jgi:hypothetical protein
MFIRHLAARGESTKGGATQAMREYRRGALTLRCPRAAGIHSPAILKPVGKAKAIGKALVCLQTMYFNIHGMSEAETDRESSAIWSEIDSRIDF